MTRKVEMPGPCRLLLPEDATVDQWLHYRTKGIGGSEVAALLGVSPYATSWDVFKSKVGTDGEPVFIGEEPVPGPRVRPELLTDNPIFEWGHRLEEAVALKVADELGGVPRSPGGLWQMVDHPVAIVTPDRVLTKPRSWTPQALIECKHSGDSSPWDVGEAPLHYMIQCQWQMMITGIHVAYLGCFILNFDRDFYMVRVDYDPEWAAELLKIAEEFWENHVLTGWPPEHDFTHPRTTEILKDQHPHVVLEAVELDEDVLPWVDVYLKAKKDAEAAEARKEEARRHLAFALGDAGAGYVGEQKVIAYPEVNTRKISAGLVRERHPEIVDECTVVSTYRRMTVKPVRHPSGIHATSGAPVHDR